MEILRDLEANGECVPYVTLRTIDPISRLNVAREPKNQERCVREVSSRAIACSRHLLPSISISKKKKLS